MSTTSLQILVSLLNGNESEDEEQIMGFHCCSLRHTSSKLNADAEGGKTTEQRLVTMIAFFLDHQRS